MANYKRAMVKQRKAYFKKHKTTKARNALLKRQRGKLKVLQRRAAAACQSADQRHSPPPPPMDETAALQALVDSTRDGGTVALKSRVYLVNGTLKIVGRSNLTIAGPAEIRSSTVGNGHRPNFRLTNGTRIAFRSLTIDGGYTRPGVHDTAIQWSHGIEILGTAGVTITDSRIRNVAGDCVYAGLRSQRATRVLVANLACEGTGRNGVSAVAVNGIRVEGGSYRRFGHIPFDVEPNPGAGFGVDGALFTGATVGKYSGPVAFAIVGDGQADNITFSNLLVTAPRGAVARVVTVSPRRRSGITYTNIVGTNPTDKPDAIRVQRTDGLTVTDNTIPNGGGVMLACNDVTALSFGGNTPNTSSACAPPATATASTSSSTGTASAAFPSLYCSLGAGKLDQSGACRSTE